MDSTIGAAARALASGDPLGALKLIALRDDPSALALRGIAMAQLGDHVRARQLLKRAARAFGAREPLGRARCLVAEAEVALALRDLRAPPRALAAATATATLEARGDRANAAHARLIAIRRLLLLGRITEASEALATLEPKMLPPALRAVSELTVAEVALRSLQTTTAATALQRASTAAAEARVPALAAEIAAASSALERPAARCIASGREALLRLADVETLLRSSALVVDACRRGLRGGSAWVPLSRRPVLFGLVAMLAEAWPDDAPRDALIARVFRLRQPDDTHRARLRVEIGRLRTAIASLATVRATARGFLLEPRDARAVVLLRPPIDGEEGSLLALLADGAVWSTSALALALDANQRTVQRALADLEAKKLVRSLGRGRARRWLAKPLTEFTTILLLSASLSPG